MGAASYSKNSQNKHHNGNIFHSERLISAVRQHFTNMFKLSVIGGQGHIMQQEASGRTISLIKGAHGKRLASKSVTMKNRVLLREVFLISLSMLQVKLAFASTYI